MNAPAANVSNLMNTNPSHESEKPHLAGLGMPQSTPKSLYPAPNAQDAEIGNQQRLVVNLANEKITTRVAPGLMMRGDIEAHQGLYIEGSVIGSITVTDGTVVIAEAGSVIGAISAQRVIVLGRVGDPSTGDTEKSSIESKGEVVLAKTAKVFGGIHSKSLIVCEGAEMEGMQRRFKG